MEKTIYKWGLALVAILWQTMPSWAVTPIPTEGLFYKIAVQQSGVYRISYDELKKIGFNDPSKVGVFGYGGALLSEKLSQMPSDILPPVPILHRNNAIFFFAQGPLNLYYSQETKGLLHTDNHYSTEGYYFLSDAIDLKNIEEKALPQSGTPQDAKYYNAYYRHEEELYSLKQSGRKLFGEAIANGSPLSIKLKTDATVINDGSAKLNIGYVALPTSTATLHVSSNGASIFDDNINRSEDYSEPNYLKGIYHLRSVPFEVNAQNEVQLDFQFSPSNERANLDFATLETHNKLEYTTGKQILFQRVADTNNALRFSFSNLPNDGMIWAILSPNNIQQVPLSSGGFVANPLDSHNKPIKFVAFSPNDAYSPRMVSKVSFTNLREHQGIPDLIIISTNALVNEAKRLATFHNEARGLNVLVATQQEVFNEFSSGTPDATAYRLFTKFFFDKWYNSTDEKDANKCPIHLLLFGDGACDNRLLSSEWKPLKQSGVELLLTYESENSLNVDSYVTDDYFALVCNNEDDLHNGEKTVAIGVGRFPIRSRYEAKTTVDKVIGYAQNLLLGNWKLNGAIIADNGDGYGHLNRGEGLAKVIEQQFPEMVLSKIYFDAFTKENKSGLTTFPGAKRKLFDAFEKGLLIVNYTGHGNPNAWSDEQILTRSDILRFDYKYLPLWITATCDFANFDNPITSAGEVAFLNPKSAAIGLVTTSRVVYDIYNQQLNTAILEEIFKRDALGRSTTFGQALKRAKNKLKKNLSGGMVNKLHFFLIGDPSITFNLPTHTAIIETINDKDVTEENNIPLHALEKVKIKGSVRNSTNSIEGNFTGHMAITVFDSKTELKTLEENRPSGIEKDATYYDYMGLLYAGQTDVKDGFFEFEYTIPKDVSYKQGSSRINLYAYSPDNKIEAMGANLSTHIATGSIGNETDTIPPQIRKCFLNDSIATDNFVTGATPIFFAEVFDANGINLSSGGLGHQITLVIDNRRDYTFVLNDYYEASLLEAGLGKIVYTLPTIEEGDHKAVLTVWDVFNNCSTHTFSFRVNKDYNPTLMMAKIYPNPVIPGSPISVEVNTNLPGESFDGYIELIDFTGKVVTRSEKVSLKSDLFAPATITFTPQTQYGTYPKEGLYIIRLVASNSPSRNYSCSAKLVIANTNKNKEP